jgi:hypothetical protein
MRLVRGNILRDMPRSDLKVNTTPAAVIVNYERSEGISPPSFINGL